MKMLKNLAAQADEWFAGAITRAREVDPDLAIDPAGRRRHDKDAIAHVNGFIDVVGDKQHRGAAILPEPQHFILQAHARERVERA